MSRVKQRVRMNFPSSARMFELNQNRPQRSIFAFQSGLVIAQDFTGLETAKDLINPLLISVELGNGMAYIFLSCITEHFQFSTIDPKNCPIWPNPMHANDSIFDKIDQIVLDGTQSRIAFLQFLLGSGHRLKGSQCLDRRRPRIFRGWSTHGGLPRRSDGSCHAQLPT